MKYVVNDTAIAAGTSGVLSGGSAVANGGDPNEVIRETITWVMQGGIVGAGGSALVMSTNALYALNTISKGAMCFGNIAGKRAKICLIHLTYNIF